MDQPFAWAGADTQVFKNAELSASSLQEAIARYYDVATEGYGDWSRDFNMHFGCVGPGINPFDREAMCEHTNALVLDSLQLVPGSQVLDLGCGLGAGVRYALRRCGVQHAVGVTLSPVQVALAGELSRGLDVPGTYDFKLADFLSLPFSEKCFEGVYAVESFCHANDEDKPRAIEEAFRVLEPGGRLSICDAFIVEGPLRGWSRYCQKKTQAYWSLGGFPELEGNRDVLAKAGFSDIHWRDLTLNMLPSALQIPWVSLRFLVKLLRRRERDPRQWHHLCAPLWGFLMGMNLRQFRYGILSARKPL